MACEEFHEPGRRGGDVVTETRQADVVVVGAGPGGSSAAFHLARHGLSVLLLEKTEFPREKVCGDGLTPRAVRQLVRMGIDTSPGEGWLHNKGLRILGGGVRMELDWPDLASFPGYGLTRTRLDFDELLARHAEKAGAELLTGHNVTGPVLDDAGRVVGVTAVVGADKTPREFRAPLVIAADGVSARLPLALGLAKREDRPIGVAVRRYYRSPRHDDDYLESWLELRSRESGDKLLPGYGWIFGHADGPILGAALPMGFNRVPHYTRGVMLVGDAGGMVNPFNGEGIAYAMESAELAAEIAVQALHRPAGPARERVLRAYPVELTARYGGYYRLGHWFVKLIGNPHVMKVGTRHGLPHPVLMRFVLKLMANLTDPQGGDAMDRIINGLARIAPAA